MSELKFWYKPNKDFIAFKITEQNPCGCCKNLVIVDKHIVGMPKINYCFYLPTDKTLNQYLSDTDWEYLT